MSNLKGFFTPVYKEETIEIEISDRFVDDDGKPLKFKIKSLTQDQIEKIAKRSYKEVNVNGKKQSVLDKIEHLNRCLVEACVQPNFKDHDLCVAYGTEDPVSLPQKMLLTREYEKLGRAFMRLNGLGEDELNDGEITKN